MNANSNSINFYGVNVVGSDITPIVKVLAVLLKKNFSKGKKSLVYSPSSSLIDDLDKRLWQVDRWLPHATECDPFLQKQPILLIENFHNPINADTLFVTDSSDFEIIDNINKICVIFNLNDVASKDYFSAMWQKFQQMNWTTSFYRQDATGKFSQDVPK